MTTTIADLERNNWELLRTKIKNGVNITIKIPINTEKYKFTGYRYTYVFYENLKEEKLYHLHKIPKQIMLGIDLKNKLTIFYKRKYYDEPYYFSFNEKEGIKWVHIKNWSPIYNEFFTDGCYKAEDILVIFDEPSEEDKQRKRQFIKSYQEFADEEKAKPPGESNYPFASEHYFEAKEKFIHCYM